MSTPFQTARAPRRKADIAGIHPLTAQQQGLLFHARESGEHAEDPYYSQDVIVLEGALDAGVLQSAWTDTVARHPILRTDFRWEDVAAPLQIVFRTRPAVLHGLDWREEADPDTALARYQAHLRRDGFDFAQAADPQLTLIRVNETRWFLLWAYHHVAVDGWSYAVVMRDLLACYRARLQGVAAALPPARSFVDYLAWLGRQDSAAAEAFWRSELSRFESLTPLPLARPETQPSDRWAELDLPLGNGSRLMSFVQRERITLNTLCQGLWALLLARLNGNGPVTFGVTVSGRPADLPGAEDMAGLFITTLPLSVTVPGAQTMAAWLRELQAHNARLRQHEHLPLARVQAQAPSGTRALFESLLVVENFPVDDALLSDQGALRAKPYERPSHEGHWKLTSGRNNYPLTLVFIPGDVPRLVFAYDRHRFDDQAVRMLGTQAQTLLKALLDGGGHAVDALGLATTEEAERVAQWGRAEAAAAFVSLPERVSQWAARSPDAVAVDAEDAVLTFAELDRFASHLALRLRVQGVGLEDRVALLTERSAAYVVGLLAVMKAGAAFLPLDPAQPESRLRELVTDAGVALLLAQDTVRGKRIAGACGVLPLKSHAENASPSPAPWPTPRADQAAYLIYTSGSTGRPKGALVSHGSLAQYTSGLRARLDLSAGLRFAMVSTVAADLGHTALFGALACGGSVHMLPAALALDPDGFSDWMLGHEIDVLKIVPSHLGGLLAAGRPELPRKLLVLGGEAASPVLMGRLRQAAPGLRIFNHYGPTETTVGVLMHEAQAEADLPLGKPLPGVLLRVLDQALQPVPAGVAGELYVGGRSLARGYLGRADLTADRFVPDPDAQGQRLYRTGDRVCWSPSGSLQFLGRIDDQVKIRGHRVEPAELAAALRQLDGVNDAAAVVRDGRLLAYVTPAGVDGVALLAQLRARLPEPMMPAHLTPLAALPLTPNGKLDRKALPEPQAARVEPAVSEDRPSTPAERSLAEIWSAVLGREGIGVHENFFELGGDSILNLQVIARARRQGLRFTPKQLFEHPTIAALAQVAVSAERSAAQPAALPADADAPLTPIQHWFFSLGQPVPHHWNQSIALHLERTVVPEVLDAALRHLLERHAALRLRFVHGAQGWRQRVVHEVPVTVLERASLLEPRKTVQEVADSLQQGLNFETGPLLRSAFVEGPAGQRLLLLAAHHLVVDSVSWRILVGELQVVYEQLASGAPVSLPAVPTDYLGWARRLATQADAFRPELSHWQKAQVPCAQATAPDLTSNTHAQARVLHTVLASAETSALLGAAVQRLRCSTEELLLCALAQALCEWQFIPAVVIEVEGHGREALFDELDLSQTVGWFTCRYPVRLLPGSEEGLPALKAVKEQLRDVPHKGMGYGVLRAHGLLPPSPAPGVAFNYLGQLDRGMTDGWLQLADEQPVSTRAAANRRTQLLDVDAHIRHGQLHLAWTHCPAVHDDAQIQALAAAFGRRLAALVDEKNMSPDQTATPSDFPLARLTQVELDRVLACWPSLQDVYPLAPLQAGLLYHGLTEEGGALYLNQLHLELRALADTGRFKEAWQDAFALHGILRTAFAWQGLEEPHQLVLPAADLPFEEIDWRDRPAADAALALQRLLAQDIAHGFALDQAPLMRITLVHTAQASHLVWTRHHLLLDGWSSARLLAEVLERYAAKLQARRPAITAPRPYRDHIAFLLNRSRADDLNFWRTQLRGLDQPTLLQPQMPAAPQGVGMGRQTCNLSPALSTTLQAQARRHGVTLNTLLQAAWGWLLSRHCGRRDVAFGISVSGRAAELSGSDAMLGLFINTVPLRVRVPVAASLSDWWTELQALNAALREHEHVQLAEMQALSGAKAGTPLFDTLLVFENYPVDTAALQAGRLALDVTGVEARETLSLPLTLIAYPGAILRLEFAYRKECFSPASIELLGRQLSQVLQRFVDQASLPVASLSLPDENAQAAAVHEIEQGVRPSPAQHTLVSRFEQQVQAWPDNVAVSCDGQHLSYRVLNDRADSLAQYLVASGVGPEVPVALCLERSLDLVVAILGVLKAGGCYVPLDPAAPVDRLRHIAADSGARCLLHDRHTQASASQLGLPLLDVAMVPQRCEALDRDVMLRPGNAAYVIYTSGSTGKPKGVAVTHANAVRLFDTTQADFGFGPGDAWTLFHSSAFDFSVWELWGALLYGGRAVVVPSAVARDQQALVQLLIDERITVLNQTPSAFHRLSEQALKRRPDALALRYVIFGGEALDLSRLAPWWQHFGDARPSLVNMYGITETTVHVTHRLLRQTDLQRGSVIGRPLGDLQLHVLDDAMQALPEGMAGELYVGGAGLARGYLHRPDLTAERFVPDPFAAEPGQRLYRSGDLARRTPEGDLVYLGRADQQVKIRGYRIELGEIEATLRAQAGVSDAAVWAQPDEDGQQRLLAFVAGEQIDEVQLRHHVRACLPDYMVPAAFTVVPALPLTVNGKLDQAALLAQQPRLRAMAPEGPRTELEATLAAIWADVLKLENLGIHDNFFVQGGHSLLATRLVMRMREATGIHWRIADLFAHPTVAAMAALHAGNTPDKTSEIAFMAGLLDQLEEEPQ